MRLQFADRLFIAANTTMLTLIALLCLFPLYYIGVLSFTDPEEYIKSGVLLFPDKWSTVSYEYIFSSQSFVRSIGVSTFLASTGTVISLFVTSGIAYMLSRKRLPGRRLLLLMILLTTLFQPGIIPPYLLVRELGLINSIWSLILPVLSSGWYVLLMKGFFDNMPDGLEEAASIDGCGDIGVWIRIILPLSLPAMAAFGLFYAVAYWNTFFHAILYINDHEKWPLQVVLRNMLIDSSTSSGGSSIELSGDQPPPSETIKMAAVMVATVPILLIYPFLQKHFAKGAMVGSVKG
jgi:putative aldouronate transport system permease protein